MKNLYASLAAALALGFAAPAMAVPLPYDQPGIENTVQYQFIAASTGEVTAYFAGSDAGYMNEITLLVNGVETGIQGLNNQTSVYGQVLNFGAVTAGDRLVFKLLNINPGTIGPFYSDRSMNDAGYNHIFSSAYAGDDKIPAGVFIGFEDLPRGGDFDYNDERFVFVNVAYVTDVPEPASIALLMAGVAGLAASRKAKRARQA